MDNFVKKIPGSVAVKSFVASTVIVALLAYPVFGISTETRQGHDYLSSEKPEAIRAGQERLRKEYRHNRNARELNEKEQQQQQQE